MADEQNRILPRVLLDHLLKIREARFWTERVLCHKFALVTHFISDKGGSLRGALERAGNNDINLHAERSQSAANIAALLNAIFVECALLIFLRARAETALPGARVA